MKPVTILPFVDTIKKTYIPVPVMDEEDCAIFCEEYLLMEDPIKASVLAARKEENVVRKQKKIYPNDPCPCGSGRKYKKCCYKNK